MLELTPQAHVPVSSCASKSMQHGRSGGGFVCDVVLVGLGDAMPASVVLCPCNTPAQPERFTSVLTSHVS